MGCEGLIDDSRVLISSIACSMDPETAVTFARGHFNKVVFAVLVYRYGIVKGYGVPHNCSGVCKV